MVKVSRAVARSHGLKQYWTGKPCANGHVDFRQASSDICMECGRRKAKTYLARKAADPMTWKAYTDTQRDNKRKLRVRKAGRPMPSTCDCCGGLPTAVNGRARLIFDHCHETGKFRGWICTSCNTGIGKLGDNARNVMRAVEYLRRAEFDHPVSVARRAELAVELDIEA